jgi:L-threonylcarbamoyladenylate synthase
MDQREKKFLEAVELLKRGEPVAFPTETVYGLGAPVFQETAVAKIFSIKGRPADNPLIVHVCCLEDVFRLALDIPDSFFILAQKFWPGPLTMVLKKRTEVPSIVSAGHPTIAIRMPDHPLALRLIRAVGEPLAAPSANLSGKPSPTIAEDVLEDFKEKSHFVLDGGECRIGIESTVISLSESIPVLLRPGAISQKELEDVLGVSLKVAGSKDPVHSPGMKYRHYAPKAKVRLVLEKENLGQSGYLLSSESFLSAVLFTRQNFYSRLREADRLGIEEITIYCSPTIQQDAGLMNRVLRAAGQ